MTRSSASRIAFCCREWHYRLRTQLNGFTIHTWQVVFVDGEKVEEI